MNRHKKLAVALLGMLAFAFLMPVNCPAPLVWTRGEGWSWVHEGVPVGATPADQLKIGQNLEAKKRYRNAIPAYCRVIEHWPLSSSTEEARMGLAECYGVIGYHYKAFQTYQELIKKNPNTPHFDEVLQREFEIANLFLARRAAKSMGRPLVPVHGARGGGL